MGEVQGCLQLQCDWFHCHMDTRATEHMYSRGGKKRILDTLSPPGNPPLQRGLFFFFRSSRSSGNCDDESWFSAMASCVTLDNLSRCAQGVGSRQTGAALPVL